MDTSVLKNFAQESRRYLMDVVTKKIEYYLTTDNVDIRAKKHLIEDLRKEISNTSKDQVIEKIAYTWFNRFCALRYMDVKQYSLVGVLTPMSESHTQPEILMEAKSGHIKDELGNPSSRDHVIGLLSGKVSTNDPQSEAYKHLVLMACNYYHSIMPFLFEKIDDYTELLMPDDLLSEASIVSKVRSALNEENCKDVEVIGWLYQFYISEKKDEVFEGLKKNKKITPENIPAATQLFTPNWIVRYLVENSLGRLWMLNRPSSNLISKMEYYIKPEAEEKDFLKIKGPEEIKVCDPACGSGHMLVYAFDLLYSMYEEVGIDSNEISSLILKNNLFGVEIDKRAGELAAFALTMKAREKQRRYFKNPVNPNICVLENIHFEEAEIKDYMDHVGHDLFSSQIRNTLYQFEEAKNFGSLIRPEVSEVATILNLLDQKNVSGHLFLTKTHSNVLRVLAQAKFLSPVYHVVIANPPYMGGKGMNSRLGAWVKGQYPDSKSDLFSVFIERCFELAINQGFSAMITMQSWMFLSSFEKMRKSFLEQKHIDSLVHIGFNSFPELNSKVALAAAFVCRNTKMSSVTGAYFNLNDASKSSDKKAVFEVKLKNEDYYRIRQDIFFTIPGFPVAYWTSPKIIQIFKNCAALEKFSKPKQGATTSDNGRFLRRWYEVNENDIGLGITSVDLAMKTGKKWFPYNKGGDFRRWYGNQEFVINYKNNGSELKEFHIELSKNSPGGRLKNQDCYFKPAISWPKISLIMSARYFPEGFIFDVAGSSIFPDMNQMATFLGILNSSFSNHIMSLLSPTLNYEAEHIARIPIKEELLEGSTEIPTLVQECIDIARADWDESELSWNFSGNPIIQHRCEYMEKGMKIETIVSEVVKIFKNKNERLLFLENEINERIICAYDLQDVLPDKFSIEHISLFSNPYHRYRKTDTEPLDKWLLLRKELIKELISFYVSVLFGRSLIMPNTIIDNDRIPLDDDFVVPILDGDYFTDDCTEQFKSFLKVVFGQDEFSLNLKFVEECLGADIRTYFLKDFYNDHVKMYKKRPIYWLFSSPNGTFNALIYLHRYTPDTVSVVLNNYLREFRTKLASKKENLERLSTSSDTSSRDKTFALKEIEQLKKMIVELDEYEKDILYPLATQRLEIDLDDGVKANYPKFGKALKPIKGLDKDED